MAQSPLTALHPIAPAVPAAIVRMAARLVTDWLCCPLAMTCFSYPIAERDRSPL
jgi:hypothetical protein